MNNSNYRCEEIAHIEVERERQREASIAAVRAVQEHCPHDRVVEGGDRRICAACGLEEQARLGMWPGHTVDGGFYEFVRPAGMRTVLNGEFIKRGDVVAYRVRI